jgi:hypothetical protein
VIAARINNRTIQNRNFFSPVVTSRTAADPTTKNRPILEIASTTVGRLTPDSGTANSFQQNVQAAGIIASGGTD